MADRYANFAQLRIGKIEGVDYRICVTERQSSAAVIAPHGGLIEPDTSEIATAIAGENHSLYCFEGLRKQPHGELHITSTRFDEPKCLNLIARCPIIVATHGMKGNVDAVDVGGLDTSLRDAIHAGLGAACFRSKIVESGDHAAVSTCNVCNKGQSGRGVQLEIAKSLRTTLVSNPDRLRAFAESVRTAILLHQPG